MSLLEWASEREACVCAEASIVCDNTVVKSLLVRGCCELSEPHTYLSVFPPDLRGLGGWIVRPREERDA